MSILVKAHTLRQESRAAFAKGDLECARLKAEESLQIEATPAGSQLRFLCLLLASRASD